MDTSKEPPSQPEVNRRELAHSLDCVTDEELQALAGVKASTTEAWRKRGTGPEYIRFGTVYLYPRKSLADHLQKLTRERHDSAKGLL
jgi:hypothetical protein